MNNLLLLLPVAGGYLLGISLMKKTGNSLKLLLAFSGAYLLGITFLHLLPEIYIGEHNHTTGLWVLVGFLVQVLLEVFSKGMEHGHKHAEGFTPGILPAAALVSLYAHAFFESVPIGATSHQHSKEVLTWAILLHKLPVSLVLFLFLKELKMSNVNLLFGMVLFALAAPAGAWIGESVPALQQHVREVTAFTVGIFLHISTTILFESSKGHRFNLLKFGSIILGIAAAWLGSLH